ncbi:MAG: PQQ-binding-like beta-propeller repeat protein [Isosphaeraceae bacterium]
MGRFRSHRVGRPGRTGRDGISRSVGVLAGLLGVVLFAGVSLHAQQLGRSGARFVPDSSEEAERKFRTAATHARDQQWSEAIDIYQRVIDQYGDKVVKRPKDEPGGDPSGDFPLYVSARRFCHQCIAHLPPEARELYRNRSDGLAERWFQEGARRRDIGLLRRVFDQAFCSSWGDDALELAGDLAFQDGRFDEALALYDQLVADRPGDPNALIHPDPSVDLAGVAAKKWLCRAAGENPPTKADLDEFARRYPGASGGLAGKKGLYATILAQALASDHLEPAGQADGRWPTFAGSPRRTRIVPGSIDVGQVQWRIELEKVAPTRFPFGRQNISTNSQAPQARLLAFHPIVLGDQVLVCDGSKVQAFNLNDRPGGPDGNESRPVVPAWKYDADNGVSAPQAPRPYSAIPRYTLTAQGNRIYARMGSVSATFPIGGRFGRNSQIGEYGSSSIVALDWNAEGRILWEVKSSNLELPNRLGSSRSINFEGTPIADAQNVYVAVTDRRDEIRIYVACFDAETGTRRWIKDLGTARPEPDQGMGFNMPMNFSASSASDYHHRLLTLDGSMLYYLTNLGSLVAIEAETGATRWLAAYPHQEASQSGRGGERDLNPAVIHGDKVIVAPSDANAIYAFDTATGKLIWKTEPISDDVKLSHILGVAKGRLVVTGDRVLLFDVQTGKLVSTWPDSANKSMEGFGRGLLAGDLIYWPTRTEIYVLDQRTGLNAQPPIKLKETYNQEGGNLSAGDGYLIIAQTDGLVVFCQNSRLIQRYREEIARAPDRASNYYRLARAAEATGQEELALKSYRSSIDKADANESIDGLPLAGVARDHLFRLLMRQAGRSRHDRRWEEAIGQLRSAAEVARAEPERLESRLLLAEILLDASRPGEAVEALEQILLDGGLRTLPVAADGHRTVRADLLIADRLAAIVRLRGRQAYKVFDRQATALYQRGKKERDPHVLLEVCRNYPAALVVPDAMEELGSVYESTGRLADAAHAYKRLLALASDDARRARAIWAMARVYDARKLYVAARDAYLDLLSRYPKVRLDPGTGPTVAERVADTLGRPPYASLIADRPQPPIPLPMVRRWYREAPADRSIRAMGIEGGAPSLEAGRILLSRRDSLRLLNPADGSVRWAAEMDGRAVWAGYLADKVIVATPRHVIALDLNQGTPQWRFDLDRSGKETPHPDPFAVGESGDERPERANRGLHDFRLVKGRLVCLRGSTDLIALDGDTGDVDWSYSTSLGEINPRLWVGPERVVLQVDRPNQLLVLRTDDGQPVARTPLADSEQLERPPLPLDDDSVLVVLDPRTVKKYDINHGQIVWEYRESEDLPVNGPPRLFGDGERVLILHEGRTLIRLDPATGSKRWSCLLGTEDLGEPDGSMALDEQRFYCIFRWRSTVTLRAILLADGVPAWTSEWPGMEDSRWSIALSAQHVIAYPNQTGLADGFEMATIPVILRGRETGALVQRFLFPATQAEPTRGDLGGMAATATPGLVTFKLDPGGASLATPRGVWGLGAKRAVAAPPTIPTTAR